MDIKFYYVLNGFGDKSAHDAWLDATVTYTNQTFNREATHSVMSESSKQVEVKYQLIGDHIRIKTDKISLVESDSMEADVRTKSFFYLSLGVK